MLDPGHRLTSRTFLSLVLAAALLLIACSSGDEAPETDGRGLLGGTDTDRHSVELADVHFDTFDGGSIPLSTITEERLVSLRDRIPPLDEPKYETASASGWLNPGDLVLGYVAPAGTPYAFPTRILNFHEIVNDELDGEAVLITFCPLCRSGVVFSRDVEGRQLSFGNTSALYQSDLVMYDRETSSYWFQVAGEAIVGELTGTSMVPLPSLMTTWAEWLALHPDTNVLSRDTGFPRSYAGDSFVGLERLLNQGDYPFPVDDERVDDRLMPGAFVLGVEVADAKRVYPIAELGDVAINEVIGEIPTVVFSQTLGLLATAYDRRVDGRQLTFEWQGETFVDLETGSMWSIAGVGEAGELAGSRLRPLATRSAFWFSYVTAFPDVTVYQP